MNISHACPVYNWRLDICKYKFNNVEDVDSLPYFENSTIGIITSWSGRVVNLVGLVGSWNMDSSTSRRYGYIRSIKIRVIDGN